MHPRQDDQGLRLGEAGEGRNMTHNKKKINEEELKEFRTRFGIPISDQDVDKTTILSPRSDSPEVKYLKERRAALGGSSPSRPAVAKLPTLKTPEMESYRAFWEQFSNPKNNKHAHHPLAQYD